MAIATLSVFEVRTTGSDNNGGGFVTGSSGTDWSQQNSAQYALTGIATSGAGAVFLSTSAASDMVGNILQVVSGTNFTTGFYQILSVSAGVSVTVDRNICTGIGSSGVINIGGALLTIATALAAASVDGNKIYVKGGTYSISTGLTTPFHDIFEATRIIGYSTTRGDNGRPIIKATAAVTGFTWGGSMISLENFELDGNSTGTRGAYLNGSYSNLLLNCVIHHWTTEGVKGGGCSELDSCEIHHCAGSNGAVDISAGCIDSCYSHDNTNTGFYVNSSQISNSVAYNNTGRGIHNDGLLNGVISCISASNTSDGIKSVYAASFVKNCIIINNGAYGIVCGNVTAIQMAAERNNAFYNNTSGNYQNLTAGVGDITLTGDPFTNAAGGDFSLNSTAGRGASCRNAGLPGVTLYGTGYADIGVLRHQDPAGGGGTGFFIQ